MEGTPLTIDTEKVKQTLLQIQGVKEVHDLHIWTVTSGRDSLTCHLVIDEDADSQEVLQSAIKTIEATYKISHSTIQIETSNFQHTSCD